MFAEFVTEQEQWAEPINEAAKSVAQKFSNAGIKIHKDPFITLIVSELNQSGKINVTNLQEVTNRVKAFVDNCRWIVVKIGKGGGVTFPNGIPA